MDAAGPGYLYNIFRIFWVKWVSHIPGVFHFDNESLSFSLPSSFCLRVSALACSSVLGEPKPHTQCKTIG